VPPQRPAVCWATKRIPPTTEAGMWEQSSLIQISHKNYFFINMHHGK
jgi:hypothetical protein